MPNPRQVPSEGQRSPSKKSALGKGFETMMTVMTKVEIYAWEMGFKIQYQVCSHATSTPRPDASSGVSSQSALPQGIADTAAMALPLASVG